MELLTELNEKSGITVIMVTHEPDMAAYARTIVHFRDGLIESVEKNAHRTRVMS
jgi:putative ABC transport system ATP-binding protein